MTIVFTCLALIHAASPRIILKSKPMTTPLQTLLAGTLIVACAPAIFAQNENKPERETPGAEKATKTKALEAGAELLQGEGPIGAIHQYVCAFHFYADDMKRQVRADHYCSHLNEEVLQCVIYDSNDKQARLIGIEYIISEALFKQLPEDEKKLWHSHRYEVMSGQLIAPGIPDAVEKEVMEKLVTTYGKTWHTWQVDRGDKLPLGLPKLMMSFTAEGQADPRLIEQRDKDLGTDTAKKKADRADIPTRDLAPGADAWEKGPAFQINDDLLKSGPAPAPDSATLTDGAAIQH